MDGTLLDRPERREPHPALRGAFVLFLIFVFLVGVSLLEGGISAMGSGFQDALYASVTNPVAGLFVGILGTVLVQSSSASTSVIVGLVASGALPVDAAVPIVMGANIGTTVTNTLVALGSVRRSEEFRRAFAAATVHDFFNALTVMVMLPLELTTGVLSNAASRISSALVGAAGTEWDSPVKQLVGTPVGWIEDGLGALGAGGTVLGIILLGIGLAIILGALTLITKNMRRLIAVQVERVINRVLARGGGLVAMLVGMLVTMAVQSSSITTSIMIPLAAAGIMTLRNIYPVTLGANLGTTITALLAALAASRPEGLTVALVHTLFNLAGIIVWYPLPGIRDVPIRLAERLATAAMDRSSVAFTYTLVLFIVVPLAGVAILR